MPDLTSMPSSKEKTSALCPNFLSRSWLKPFSIILFCFFLFILGIGRWDLWNPDEPRYGQVALEMVEGGDWILMHVNGRIYTDKPPLFFWLIGLSSYLWQGFTSFAVRFPSAFFGTLSVLLIFFFGKSLYSSRIGFLSSLILATTVEFTYLATRANIDATLTFFTTASLFCFHKWDHLQKGGEEGMRSFWIYGFYVSMGLATLAKGPVGFILPLLVSLTYFLLQKDWRGLRSMKLLPGLLLTLSIILIWYLPALWKGGKQYLDETLLGHTIERFASGTSHIRPFYYYMINFPLDFFPWTLFLPVTFIHWFKRKEERKRKEFLFLLVWFISVFLFFSISKGKRSLYLLPLFPAVSLLVGVFWDAYLFESDQERIRRIWIKIPNYLLAVLLFGAGMLLLTIPQIAGFQVKTTTSGITRAIIEGAKAGNHYLSFISVQSLYPVIFLLISLSLTIFIAQYFNYKRVTFILIVATVGMVFFYGTRIIFPLVNPYKSARFISQEIQQVIRRGDKLAMYGDYGSAGTAPYNFYTGIVPILEVDKEDDLFALFRSDQRIFCLFKYPDYVNLQRKYPDLFFRLLTRRQVGDRDMVLVSNQ